MSKISTYEKFFIGVIAEGLEESGDEITQGDIELLLSECIVREEGFSQKIKNALAEAHPENIDASVWDEYIVKLYKGRETILRDLVIEWCASYRKPGFWERVRSLFRK